MKLYFYLLKKMDYKHIAQQHRLVIKKGKKWEGLLGRLSKPIKAKLFSLIAI